MFKKKKIKDKKISLNKLIHIHKYYQKSQNSNWIIWSFIWLLSIILIFLLGLIMIKQVSNFSFMIDSLVSYTKDLWKLPQSDPEWKTNILVLGKWWWWHEAPDLTDTIMLVSVNFSKNIVSMLSIPRDLYVEYDEYKAWKINEMFFYYKRIWLSDKEAIEKLKSKVSEITWEDINYYLWVDFKWFIKIVDTIWGVEVDVPEKLVDHTYPDSNWGYQTFRVNKGLQLMDWNTALKYARSRHSTSDFDRSLRQQLIISAIKEKVTSLGYLTSPSKVKWLFLALKENINTSFSNSEMINLALYLKKIPKENIISSNLNDTCFYWSDICQKWWFLYTPIRENFNNLSVLLPNWADKLDPSNYTSIQKYTNLVFNYPEIYIENYPINIYNSTRNIWLATSYSENLKRYGFNIKWIWNARDKVFTKSKIIYNWISSESNTIEALKMFIFGWSQKYPQAMYSKDPNIKIEIVIWEDYKYLIY